MARPIQTRESMAGLREQIKANLTATLDPTALETANIIVSKTTDHPRADFTAWVIVGDCRPIVKGSQGRSAEAALEKLLEATAELVGEKLADRSTGFEGRAGTVIDYRAFKFVGDVLARDETGTEGVDIMMSMSQSSTGAEQTVDSAASGQGHGKIEKAEAAVATSAVQTFVSPAGYEYKITDGSCCGHGPEGGVTYCSG